jgi:hypothetical protein
MKKVGIATQAAKGFAVREKLISWEFLDCLYRKVHECLVAADTEAGADGRRLPRNIVRSPLYQVIRTIRFRGLSAGPMSQLQYLKTQSVNADWYNLCAKHLNMFVHRAVAFARSGDLLP